MVFTCCGLRELELGMGAMFPATCKPCCGDGLKPDSDDFKD